MRSDLNELYEKLNITPKSDFSIGIVYAILNPIVSNYFNINPINTDAISYKNKVPILYLSRHYDELDILFQQKISKDYRKKYPNYLVKKDLEFLNYFKFGVVPYYRGRDIIDLNLKDKELKKYLDYNKSVINELIPAILADGQDFLIYPEGTRRKGKRFRVKNDVLEDIISIVNNTKNNYNVSSNIVIVDYKRNDKNIDMKFSEPLVIEDGDLKLSFLKDYLYSNINY